MHEDNYYDYQPRHAGCGWIIISVIALFVAGAVGFGIYRQSRIPVKPPLPPADGIHIDTSLEDHSDLSRDTAVISVDYDGTVQFGGYAKNDTAYLDCVGCKHSAMPISKSGCLSGMRWIDLCDTTLSDSPFWTFRDDLTHHRYEVNLWNVPGAKNPIASIGYRESQWTINDTAYWLKWIAYFPEFMRKTDSMYRIGGTLSSDSIRRLMDKGVVAPMSIDFAPSDGSTLSLTSKPISLGVPPDICGRIYFSGKPKKKGGKK
jgi:hypothetical protein